LGIGPNPQSPIPNPQYSITKNILLSLFKLSSIYFIFNINISLYLSITLLFKIFYYKSKYLKEIIRCSFICYL
ncbi:MAG: hypothetical protein MJ252_20895, partial [archaeon]|nr:hypothetical protein [archaeon]